MSTVDIPRYMALLKEFEILRAEPGNLQYQTSPRGVDYLGLMIHGLTLDGREIPSEDPLRIVYIHSELTYMLENACHKELINLKSFLEQHEYCVTITRDLGDVVVTINAPSFDFVVIID